MTSQSMTGQDRLDAKILDRMQEVGIGGRAAMPSHVAHPDHGRPFGQAGLFRHHGGPGLSRTVAITPSRRKALIVAGVSSLALLAGAPAGYAACGTGTANGSGGTSYSLSGADTAGCALSSNDRITVESTGSITTSGISAIDNGSSTGTRIVNEGTVETDWGSLFNKAAINNEASGQIGSIVNSGTINALAGANAIRNLGTINLLRNTGTITATNDVAIDTIGSAVTTIDNTDGTISVINNATGIKGDTISTVHLNNTRGTISALVGEGVKFNGTSTIDNTDGTIRATDGIAAQINGTVQGIFENTGGLLTSENTDTSGGSLEIDNQTEVLNIHGGTVQNTWADNTAVAVYLGYNNANEIKFDDVDIVSDGAVANSGGGVAFYFDEVEPELVLNLTESTTVRGKIVSVYGGSSRLVTKATINGDIDYSDSGDDQITVNGGVINGNIDFSDYDDVLTINAGTLNGTIDMGDANDTVNLNGGTVANDLAMGAGGDTMNLNGGTMANNVAMGDGDDTFAYTGGSLGGTLDFGIGSNTLYVDGSFANTQTITTGAGGDTTVFVSENGLFTVTNALGLGTGGNIITSAGGTFYVSSSDVTANDLNNAGTVQIANGRRLTLANNISATAGHFKFDTAGQNGQMETGHIDTGLNAVDISNDTVVVNYTGGELTAPTESLIMTGTGAANITGTTVVDNSYLYNFGLMTQAAAPGAMPAAPSPTSDVYLVLTEIVPIEEGASTDNNKEAGDVLWNELNPSTDPTIQEIQNRMVNAPTRKALNDIIESTVPTVDTGNSVAAIGMTGAMFDLADGQLAMMNTGGATGVASGDSNDLGGLHFWLQGFGSNSTQDERGGIQGYDADVWGLAAGVDTRNLREDTTLGISFGYANTSVDSKNANRTKTDVDGYQLMLYANHDMGDDFFANGMLLGGLGKNDQTRHDVGGIPGLHAKADYDSWTAGARVAVGKNFQTGEGNRVKLTPQLFAEYVHFSSDSYDEDGAAGANLSVDGADQDILNLGVSLQAEKSFELENGAILKPNVHASYKYDVIGDSADTSASFTAGGSTFDTKALDPADSTFQAGVGLKLIETNGWDVTANYDYTFKSDYDSHSGFLRVAYEF
ncbi:MAG: autotransporter domain-containing protein [Geminicoccaceae bacterium]|nr:autotransporter domain-containing protein [Geminicoccaceae bacterium]